MAQYNIQVCMVSTVFDKDDLSNIESPATR